MDMPWGKKKKVLEKKVVQKELGALVGVEEMLDKVTYSPIGNYLDAYQNMALVTQCVNATAFYTTRKGFTTVVKGPDQGVCDKIKLKIDNLNKKVDMDTVLTIAVIKRDVFGRAAFEIVRDANENIVKLLVLSSNGIVPHLSTETQTIDYYDYTSMHPTNDTKTKLYPKDILYFPRLPLERNMLGTSAIHPIMDNVKTKQTLSKDLLESAKRLWAPIGIYEMDTSYIKDPTEKRAAMKAFANELQPGRSVIHNKSIKGTVIDLKPDIRAIILALEYQDQEIMANWQMPKAILAREKTVTKATLAEALNALYEGPVAMIQRYFKRALESQWYDMIVREMKYDPEIYKVSHVWNPIVVYDAALITALSYAVRVGAMSKREFFDKMNWEILETTTPAAQGTIENPPSNVQADIDELRERVESVVSMPEETKER